MLTEASLVSRSDKILLTLTYISGISPEVVSLFFKLYLLLDFGGEWVSPCATAHVLQSEDNFWKSLFFFYLLWTIGESNPSGQGWWQIPSPTEPSHWLACDVVPY